MLLFLLPALAAALPRFEVHWESEESYENVDPVVSPWYIRLCRYFSIIYLLKMQLLSGDINVGPPGHLEGPSVVTIDSADYCVGNGWCQEYWTDEFCSKYPPEGVPNKPRAVNDWGTKYGITSYLVQEGIKSIHGKGGQVFLSYGGRHSAPLFTSTPLNSTRYRSGISAQGGGGDYYAGETLEHAELLAARIYMNIREWDLDGVDFYHLGSWSGDPESGPFQNPGTNAAYALAVVRNLHGLAASWGTKISYSTLDSTLDSPDIAIISAIHPYLDFITLNLSEPLSEEMLIELDFLGIPLRKIGIMIGWGGFPSSDIINQIVGQVKELGMAGVSLHSINMENESFRGELAKTVAEALYGA